MRIFTKYPNRQPRSTWYKILKATLTLIILIIIVDQLRIYSYSQCKFLPEDVGGIPVVLIALGRSGSSVTWDTMSALTGERTVAYEVTGQTPKKSIKFFRSIRWSLGSRWAVLRLCSIQKKQPADAGIYGFQWKPFKTSIHHKYAIGAFKDMGQQLDPPMRVVYLIRNPLDRKASNIRHGMHRKGETLPAHCAVGDEQCVRRHQESSKGTVNFSTETIVPWLRGDRVSNEMIKDTLSMNGIRYISVDYEKLYRSESAEEWMRIFRFLGRGPMENLTISTVRETFSIAATTSADRNSTITNFREVEKKLRNTPFEYLLYN